MDQGAKPPNKEEIGAWLRQPGKSRERNGEPKGTVNSRSAFNIRPGGTRAGDMLARRAMGRYGRS